MKDKTVKVYKKISREESLKSPVNKITKVVQNKKKQPKPFIYKKETE